MKDWRSVALIALVALILGRESGHTQPAGSFSAEPLDLNGPISVRITEPVPVIMTTPVNPPVPVNPPAPKPPSPGPTPDSTSPDTALARSGRNYIRIIRFSLPQVWKSLADKIEQGEITDKPGAIRYHNGLSASLNRELDQMFASGIDPKGKIINPSVIVVPLRQSAAALGRSD